ncbi:Protein-N-glutamine methyltransferase [Rhodovulum sp. PH10]|uniref:peptide chain release factor N(5)-glutamine methyltransferase n=1 Tax=Rhodovulum sp. PH10 TaxID=1187851 RepID=UPI00027C1FD1|nr:peptide chain release factor N(5)-glutamine methyltransferase [Rhodovulum sp. PH10]EJW12949.1 Protein-N-glutamine methyltransferase [Rhodovulum sp. PH10]
MVPAGITIAQARRVVTAALRENGVETPALDARLMIGHALALDHAGLVSAAERALDGAACARIASFVTRRLAGEPVSRILGCREFWGLPLLITSAVLDPRPDTETVVEAALAALDATGGRARAKRIADLGVGSGALLLALLTELPHACGVATDRSIDALQVARKNAETLALHDRAHFVLCDFGSALAGKLDLVVSNPPYVVRDAIATLAPEVREYDPHLALDGGVDGLDAYRAIAADARRLVAPGGVLAVEIGIGQERSVPALFEAVGLVCRVPYKDLSGVPRAVVAQLPT